MENQQLVSPSRQCSSTPVGFGQGFLSKEQSGNIAASPPYFRKPAPADFYLLPRITSVLKEGRFCDATDITKNATEWIKRLLQNGL